MPDPAQNVIIFGESGVGKSSIINLVVGSRVAETSPDAEPCTTRTRSYDAVINEKSYKLWDTPGLNEGTFRLFRAAVAERKLRTFLRKLNKNEPSLLIYCARASRATRALVRHYQLVRLATRESPLPMVIVVTGLENAREDMEGWWDRNAAALSSHGMEFVDHACITSIDDDPHDPILARTRRIYSQDAVRDLISRNCVPRELNGNDVYIPQVIGRQGASKGLSWIVWTYILSTLFLN